MTMQDLVGSRATVTIAISGRGGPGEVLIETAGGTQKVAAYSTETIPSHALVVIYDVRPGGVEVALAD